MERRDFLKLAFGFAAGSMALAASARAAPLMPHPLVEGDPLPANQDAHPAVTSAIIGPRTMEHLADALCALEVTITDQDRARLDAVSEPEQAIVPYYTGKLINFKPPQHRW